jgi:hypothetical protein
MEVERANPASNAEQRQCFVAAESKFDKAHDGQ